MDLVGERKSLTFLKKSAFWANSVAGEKSGSIEEDCGKKAFSKERIVVERLGFTNKVIKNSKEK